VGLWGGYRPPFHSPPICGGYRARLCSFAPHFVFVLNEVGGPTKWGAIAPPPLSAQAAYIPKELMRINRPLSPHLSVYKPQLTSVLSIFHRISGTVLAITAIASIFCLKVSATHFNTYPVYWLAFVLCSKFNWLVLAALMLAFFALCYHMSNGVRHLLWDMGFFLDLNKIYTSAFVMLASATSLVVINLVRFYAS
jgi:succinate dehydrogenase / fumarate reductase cytochrome b subunit